MLEIAEKNVFLCPKCGKKTVLRLKGMASQFFCPITEGGCGWKCSDLPNYCKNSRNKENG
jgi:predicted RNA-binding Zn-ribbon protein involved in translation (DUF1610 family)